MLRSMTAHSRATLATPFGRLTVEIQTLNRRHLEINTSLPREWLGFDSEIKEQVANAVQRGQVNVTLIAAFERESPLSITPNLALVQQLKGAWEQIASALGTSLDPKLCMNLLAKEQGLMLYEVNVQDEGQWASSLHEALEISLKQLIEMKQREGERLQQDIVQRLKQMRQAMKQIGTKAPDAVTKFRQKLKERLEEVLAGSVGNEEKLLREVSVYAEKVDITEEITRFESHLSQCEQLIQGTAVSVGKTVEFLLQELNREINTIASKASDAEVARLVVQIKAELERIREQIQNVE